MVAVPSGPYGGLLPPVPVSGINMGIYPYGYNNDGAELTLVTNTIYYVPFPIFRTTTFIASAVGDTGATTGKTVRTGIYAEAAGGGPGALLKDFGTVTCTGGSGILRASSSVTISGPQMCYAAVLSNAAKLGTMNVTIPITAVGMLTSDARLSFLGDIGNAGMSGFTPAIIAGWSATQAFGALPSTATAPAANVYATEGTTTGCLPAVQFIT